MNKEKGVWKGALGIQEQQRNSKKVVWSVVLWRHWGDSLDVALSISATLTQQSTAPSPDSEYLLSWWTQGLSLDIGDQGLPVCFEVQYLINPWPSCGQMVASIGFSVTLPNLRSLCWSNGSWYKNIAVQAWGSEVSSSEPCKRLGRVWLCICDSSVRGGVENIKKAGACWTAARLKSASFWFSEGPCLDVWSRETHPCSFKQS